MQAGQSNFLQQVVGLSQLPPVRRAPVLRRSGQPSRGGNRVKYVIIAAVVAALAAAGYYTYRSYTEAKEAEEDS